MKATLESVTAVALSVILGSCAVTPRSIPSVDARATPETVLIQICSQCHGADGRSGTSGVPHLAAQQPEYLTAQLLAFRDRSRGGELARTNMWPVAAQLSDSQIEGLATLIGGLKPAAAEAEAEAGAQMSAGRRIYFEGIEGKAVPPCMMCHGLKGEGLGSFPRLANQRREYLLSQLGAFREGGPRPPSPMTLIAPKLSEEERSAVSAFLQGMPP